jgi:hypothetical protein
MADEALRTVEDLSPHATERRERDATTSRATVVATLRWITLASVISVLVACGGSGKQTDKYARATDVQGQCCEHLTGLGRDDCLRDIVRIADPEAAKTSTSQRTYACVVEHFVCNPATGRPTQQSAQAQYDCIEDQ